MRTLLDEGKLAFCKLTLSAGCSLFLLQMDCMRQWGSNAVQWCAMEVSQKPIDHALTNERGMACSKYLHGRLFVVQQ